MSNYLTFNIKSKVNECVGVYLAIYAGTHARVYRKYVVTFTI